MDPKNKKTEHWLRTLDKSTRSQVSNAWHKDDSYEDHSSPGNKLDELKTMKDITLTFVDKDKIKNNADGLDLSHESDSSPQ